MPSIYVSIVTFNASKWISTCIDPLLGVNDVHIVVVDNASTDDTLSVLQEEKYASVEIIQNDKNLGFGAANNLVIEKAIKSDIPYVLLLNQDAEIHPDQLSQLKDGLEQHTNVGIISPMHYFAEKQLDLGFESHLEEHTVATSGRYTEVKFVNAAIWLLPTQVLKAVKGFDPQFFHYGEDRDFCMRLNNRTIPIWVDNQVKGFHYREQTIDFNSYSKEKQLLLHKYGLLARLKHTPSLLGPYFKAWSWSGMHMMSGLIRGKGTVRYIHSKMWLWLSSPSTFFRIKKNDYR